MIKSEHYNIVSDSFLNTVW